MKMRITLAVLLCGMVPGYAAAQVYWVPIPGRSLPQDQHECLSSAQQYSSQSSANVNPYGGVGSSSSGYVVNQPLFMSCMSAKGYLHVTKKDISSFRSSMNKGVKLKDWEVLVNEESRLLVLGKYLSGSSRVILVFMGSGSGCGWILGLPAWQGFEGAPDYLSPKHIEMGVGNNNAKRVRFVRTTDVENNNAVIKGIADTGLDVFVLNCDDVNDVINEAESLSGKANVSPLITLIGSTMKGRIMIDLDGLMAAFESAGLD